MACNEVGGDLLDVVEFNTSSDLYIADVSGHGVAGHLPIVHFRPSTGVIDYLGKPSPPLGAPLQQRKTAIPTGHVAMEPGDLFLLLTDGLTEVHDRKGKELGSKPIEDIIRYHHHEPLSTLHDRILRLVDGHGSQHDDRTLLLVRALSMVQK